VLDRQSDAVCRKLRALNRFDQPGDYLGRQIGVFAKRLMNAIPTWFRRQIGHVAIHSTQPYRRPLLRHDLAKLSYELQIPCRGETWFLRPLREGIPAYSYASSRILLNMIASIRLEQNRNSKPRILCKLLYTIDEDCSFTRCNLNPAAPGGNRRIRCQHNGIPENEARHSRGKSSALSFALRRQSSYASSRAFVFRSRKRSPSTWIMGLMRDETSLESAPQP
jgi:hypothetical protein